MSKNARQLFVSVPIPLDDALIQRCTELGLTKSQALRKAIHEFLRSKPADAPQVSSSLRLPARLIDMVNERAEDLGLSLNDGIRQALVEWVDRPESEAKAS